MPQPLSHVHPTLGYVLAAGNAPHSPAMAVATLAVINLWSQIDYNYGALVATIGKTDPETVTAVFQSMVSGEAKRDAVLAAARTSLAPEQASLIAAVIESTKPSRKTRNDFAHHLWGALHGRDDCVILVHPKTLAKYTAKMFSWAQRPNDPRPDLVD